jgi:galactose mutarotase-like enzyme
MSDKQYLTLADTDGTVAVVAPELGGWLLRYSRTLPKHGPVEALHFSQAVVDRYPREMWAGNPILFPLVGSNRAGDREHSYAWKENLFEMPQHGFARRSKWKVLEQTPVSISLELTDTDATRACYPFAFRLCFTYRLSQGRLLWEEVIENRSAEPMPFGTGVHPYFAVPFTPKGDRAACFVEVPDAKRLIPIGKFERFTTRPFPGQNWSVDEDVSGTLFLTDELEAVLNFEEAPEHRFAALWSKSTSHPFYCLEPWTSLPNAFSRTKDQELIMLDPQKTFRAAMWMELRPMG